MKYTEYLNTDYWKAVTAKVKERAEYRCQLCNSQHDLCAHHRTYDHRGREMEFLGDLVCLCRRCHEIFHGKSSNAGKHGSGSLRAKHKSASNVSAFLPVDFGPITLTSELVERCRTANGGFTAATVKALGVTMQSKGWPSRLVGMVIGYNDYKAALEGREVYATKR